MAGAIDYPISKPGNIYDEPYSVLTSYTLYGKTYPGAYAGEYSASIGGQYSGMANGLNLIIQAMTTAANNEEAREEALFQAYINIIPENTKLRRDFEGLIHSKNYSQAFDTLMKTYTKMYDFNKTLKENQELFNEINDLYLSGHFVHSLMDEVMRSHYQTNKAAEFGEINLNMTGAEFIENIINRVEQQVIEQKRLQGKELKHYKVFLEKMKEYIREIFIDSYGIDSLSNSLKTLEDNDQIKKKRKEKKGKHANAPLNELVYNQIWGLLNGMGLEVVIDLNGGVKTGDIKNKGQNIKTDDIILMSAEGSLVFEDDPKLKQDVKNITSKYDLDDFLAKGAFKDNFIIMTSAKDQSLSGDFNNKFTKNAIKFAEEAQLEQRIADIRQFGSVSGAGGVDDLIFALANLASDLVCAGEAGAVKQALGALCVNWMFDDIGELVVNVPMINNAQKICVYNVSGRYYTLSGILRKTIAKIKKTSGGADLVNVKLKYPNTSSYNEIALNTEEGTSRWNAVRKNIMSSTTLGFELKTKNLFNAFY